MMMSTTAYLTTMPLCMIGQAIHLTRLLPRQTALLPFACFAGQRTKKESGDRRETPMCYGGTRLVSLCGDQNAFVLEPLHKAQRKQKHSRPSLPESDQ